MICVSLPLSAHFFFSTSFICWGNSQSCLGNNMFHFHRVRLFHTQELPFTDHMVFNWAASLEHLVQCWLKNTSTVVTVGQNEEAFHSPFAPWFSQPFLDNCSLFWTISLIITLPPAIYPSLDFIPFFCLTGSLRYEPVVRGINKTNIWWITQYGILVLA